MSGLALIIQRILFDTFTKINDDMIYFKIRLSIVRISNGSFYVFQSILQNEKKH
jgi:hypothetical protein